MGRVLIEFPASDRIPFGLITRTPIASSRWLWLVCLLTILILTPTVWSQTTSVNAPSHEEQCLSRLSSSDQEQVLGALEMCATNPATKRLKAKVKSLAERSDDPVISGFARLLATDWGIELDDISVAKNRMTFKDNPEPESKPEAKPELAPAAPDLPPVVDRIPAIVEVPNQSGLTPQTPFWAQPASFELAEPDFSVPADTDTLNRHSDIRPDILDRPIVAGPDALLELNPANFGDSDGLLTYERNAPLGFTGPSGVVPTEFQQSDHFVPIEDRWRIGFPAWDRYGKGHPEQDDYPFVEGDWLDPYNQNVFKGDYPIIGQHVFYSITATSMAIHEFRQTPTATTPFESTRKPFSAGFFGNPDQIFYAPYFKFTFELFHGNEAFKPLDWKFHFTPVFNVNHLNTQELAVVRPDVRRGTNRTRDDFALEEWFIEAKLADIGPDYDFVSTRVGSQLFVSDFRGFLFRDINRGIRLFGTRFANRDQFNVIWLDQAEKDTNSELNTFDDRHQNVVIANYFRQDFVFPGYTALASFHYNRDKPSTRFDDNDFLVRPDPTGVFKEHQVDAYYIGFGGEGHLGRINLLNQFYVALGEDSTNPIGGTKQTIDAQMAAVELSYDRDWIRFRTSFLYASGDEDPNDGKAKGFDTILDDPIFAGGEFSYWQRQSVRLFGANLTQRKSIVPNLRSSKTQGQSNFVNPGLQLFNFGMDFEVTPKLKVITNANYLEFDETAVLEVFTFQDKINREIGTDLSLGVEYRPLLNDNAIVVFGVATLIPDRGLKDLYGTSLPPELEAIGVGDELNNEIPDFTSIFCELVLTY